MNDFSMTLKSSKCGCNINGTYTNHDMYADDSCMIAAEETSIMCNDKMSKHNVCQV